MEKFKTLLIIGASVFAAGVLAFVIGMFSVNWKFADLNTYAYTDSEYAITDTINSVSVSAGTAHIEIRPIDTEHPKPVVFSHNERKHNVYADISVENGQLKIRQKYEWGLRGINIISVFSFKQNKIIAYLPVSIGGVDIVLGSGYAGIYDMTIGELSADVSSGRVELQNSTADTLDLEISSGSAKIADSTVGDLKVNLKSGNVKLDNITVSNINAKIDSGYVSGSILGSKADYTISVSVDSGYSNLSDQTGSTNKRITVKINSGSLKIKFI